MASRPRLRWRACRRPPTTGATWPQAPQAWRGRSTTVTASWPRASARRWPQRGMLFVGLDVIGGFVTEINVTSPTGVREIDKQFGTDLAALLIDAIDRRLAERASPALMPIQLAEPLAEPPRLARRRSDGTARRASPRDRLTTMIVLAALLHGMVILGITLSTPLAQKVRCGPGHRGAAGIRRAARGARERHRHLSVAAHADRLGQYRRARRRPVCPPRARPRPALPPPPSSSRSRWTNSC